MPEQFIIKGTVTFPEERQRSGLLVHVYDRDLPSLERRTGSVQLLGKDITDPEGQFSVVYTPEHFYVGETLSQFPVARSRSADVSFQVYDEQEIELKIKSVEALHRQFGPEEIIFNAPQELNVNITLESVREQETGDSEYEKLVALMTPLLDGLAMKELTDEDLKFVTHELNLDQQPEERYKIEWLRFSSILSGESTLPAEAFYGWGRVGMPSNVSDLVQHAQESWPHVLNEITALPAEKLRSGLQEAISSRIIPLYVKDQFTDIVYHLERRDYQRSEVQVQLIDKTTGMVLPGYSVTAFEKSGNEEYFLGFDVTDPDGRFSLTLVHPSRQPAEIPAVELKLELVHPAGERLSPEVSFSFPLNGQELITVEVAVPQPPAPVIQDLLQELSIQLPPNLSEFLNARQIKTFADIRSIGGLKNLPDIPQNDNRLLEHLEALANLDCLSDNIQLNYSLLQKNFNSIQAIAAVPLSEFISQTRDVAGSFRADEARAMHKKASVQTSFLDNLFLDLMVNKTNAQIS